MDFEEFMRDFSRKFQEGIPQNPLFSGVFYGFHLSWIRCPRDEDLKGIKKHILYLLLYK